MISTAGLAKIEHMTAEELEEHIESSRTKASALNDEALILEREAALNRRQASELISEMAYARLKLRQLQAE